MNKRLTDVVNSNLYLFDLLFRHQVYLEGLKVGMNVYFIRMLRDLYGEFAKYLMQTRYDTLDGLTAVELRNFIHRFQVSQSHYYNRYTQQLIDLLKQFVAADLHVTTAIYAKVNSNPTAKPTKQAEAQAPTVDFVWSSAMAQMVPASGQTVREMLMNFGTSMLQKVSQQINISHLNDQTFKELATVIAGSSDASFNDGLFSTFNNQSAAIIATTLQYLSSAAQSAIASQFYAQYQWISILDSHTTLICRSRNGNVYIYGEGPLPPAHWLCRSKVVALTEGEALHDIPNTFYQWAVDQPDEFLRDALVSGIAARMMTKDSSLRDISVSRVAKPLTISEFKNKIDLITL